MSFFRVASAKVETLLSEPQLRARIAELGAEISGDYSGRELALVGVLKGCFPFYADLCRNIDLALTCDFIGLSSYGNKEETSGVVRITSDLTQPVKGKHVLVVEDIVDTGLTMQYLLNNLKTRFPASVRVCALLHKPSRSRVHVPVDYVGFTIPDQFVLGYGLDYEGQYRNLPYIGVMKGV
jgi:hypoxanthine phosphoribosyltransferase